MKYAGLIAATIAAAMPLALAHEGATGIVKERMVAMTESAKAMKAAAEAIRANRNLASVSDDAKTVAANAARIAALFPPGSVQQPTDAKPEIWSNWDDFRGRAAQLANESGKLAAAADTGDPTAVAAQFRVVGKTCAGCHELYRIKP